MGRIKENFLCNICKCTLTDKSNFKRHLSSLKHKDNLKASGLKEDDLILEIVKEQSSKERCDKGKRSEGLEEYIKFMNSLTSS